MVIDFTGSKSKIVNLPMRPGELPNATVCADVSTLALVDMSPKMLTPLDNGLKKTIEYYKSLCV
jgi:UDP-glucose 4-epimerase